MTRAEKVKMSAADVLVNRDGIRIGPAGMPARAKVEQVCLDGVRRDDAPGNGLGNLPGAGAAVSCVHEQPAAAHHIVIGLAHLGQIGADQVDIIPRAAAARHGRAAESPW